MVHHPIIINICLYIVIVHVRYEQYNYFVIVISVNFVHPHPPQPFRPKCDSAMGDTPEIVIDEGAVE